MSELRFQIARFQRRFHWFAAIALTISLASLAYIRTLPPIYQGELRLMMESKQIPDELAQSTVASSAMEQLQIVEQRLLTRDNLLRIAADHQIHRDQAKMTADQIARAMRSQTRIRTQSGRNQATIMTITFEAPEARSAAGVLNAYLSLIIEQNAEFRTGRAATTQDFFEQQVAGLKRQLDRKTAQILDFKTDNADALPETLTFRMSEQSELRQRAARIEGEILTLRNQRAQLIRLDEATRRIGSDPNKSATQLSPRQLRLSQLHHDLTEARSVYAEDSAKVRHLKALIRQFEADERQQPGTADAASGEGGSGAGAKGLMLDIQVADIDARISVLEQQLRSAEAQRTTLGRTIARTPANVVALEALERDHRNILTQYNQAVGNLSRAQTGERIEFMARGQRIAVIDPPSVPSEPAKPNRKKLALAGIGIGVLCGLALVYLLETLSHTPRRAEDVLARFDVMPIATIPFTRSQRQVVAGRAVAALTFLAIGLGLAASAFLAADPVPSFDFASGIVMGRLEPLR